MHLLRLANSLDRDLFDVTVAVLDGGGAYETMLRDDVDVVILGRPGGSTVARFFRASRPLRKLVESRQPDVLCPVMDIPAVTALFALRNTSRETAVVPLVQCVPSYAYGKQGGWIGRLVYRAMQRWYPRADRIIALSHGVADDVKKIVGSRTPPIDVIHNAGVDKTVRASALAASQADLDRPSGPLVVACGRLAPVKDYPTLVRAMSLVVEQIPGAVLWIVGEGPERSRIEALVQELGLSDSVDLLGFQSDPFAFMAAADVFALSSRHEGFGNVVVEAMACGTPVVSSDCPHGPGEIIDHGVNGLLVPPGDPAALAAAIARVLLDRELQTSLADAGLARSEDFDVNLIARQYEDRLCDVVASTAG